jgi:hypothetical protein
LGGKRKEKKKSIDTILSKFFSDLKMEVQNEEATAQVTSTLKVVLLYEILEL